MIGRITDYYINENIYVTLLISSIFILFSIKVRGYTQDGFSYYDVESLRDVVQSEKPINFNGKTFFIKGSYNIRTSIKNATFCCDSITKLLITGDNVIIKNCIFDVNNHSVDRSLIECLGRKVIIKNCVIKNIKGDIGKGAYGIFIDIEKCSSIIKSCEFINISDSRKENDPVGKIKGMCGGILYSSGSYIITSNPQKQVAEDILIENVFTSIRDGKVNEKSYDADGIRVFINDAKTPKVLLHLQNYCFNNIKGKDVQKRLIKLSGAYNCEIKDVTYGGNQILSNRFPSHLIAVYDSDNININDVDYVSGCNDIAFCCSNSANVILKGVKVRGNVSPLNNSTSSLFRVNKCNNLSIRSMEFWGKFNRLGQLYNSENIFLQLKGENLYFINPIEIKDVKNLMLTGAIKKYTSKMAVKCINVDNLSVGGNLARLKSQVLKFERCNNVIVKN